MNSKLRNKYIRMSVMLSYFNMTELEADRGEKGRTIAEISEKMDLPAAQIRNDLMYILANPVFRNCYGGDLDDLPALIQDLEDQKEGWETIPIPFIYSRMSAEYDGTEEQMVCLNTVERALVNKVISNGSPLNEVLTIKHLPETGNPGSDTLEIEGQIQAAIEFGYGMKVDYDNRPSESPVFPVKILYTTSNQMNYGIFFKKHDAEEELDQTHNQSLFFLCRLDHISKIRLIPNEKIPELNDRMKAELDRFDYIWGADAVPEAEPVTVRVKIFAETNNILSKIRGDISGRKYAKLEPSPTEENVYYYTDQVIGMHSFRRWLFLYGNSVVVLEPKELAKSICDSAKKKLAFYQSGSFERNR